MCAVKQNYIGTYYKALVIDRVIFTIYICIYDIYNLYTLCIISKYFKDPFGGGVKTK